MMKQVIFLIGVLGVTWCLQPRYRTCGGSGKIESVDVKPCQDPRSCIFTKGNKASINVQFIANKVRKQVKTKVYGHIAGVNIPFPLDTCGDACEGCGVQCPLVVGKPNNFTVSLDVKTSYPSLKLVVELHLEDGGDASDIICMQFGVQIK